MEESGFKQGEILNKHRGQVVKPSSPDPSRPAKSWTFLFF